MPFTTRDLQEHTHIGTWSIDCRTQAVLWSRGMYALHGTECKDLTPDVPTMAKLYPRLSNVLFAWALRTESVENEHFSAEFTITRFDGHSRQVLLCATPHTRDGCFERITGSIYDLQGLEAERIAAAETEQSYQLLFQNSPNGLIQAGGDKRILLVNPAFCRLLGYSAEELRGRTTEDITHPNDHASSAEHVRRLWSGEEAHSSYEKRYIRKDGTPVWIQIGLSVVRGIDGTPLNFIGQCQDISERKAAEATLLAEIALKETETGDLAQQNEQLRELISTDTLTQLSNRYAYETILAELKADPRDGSDHGLIMIEVEGLAIRNRNHGEDAVDELLRSVSKALLRSCPGATCIARISGGSFRVIFRDLDEQTLRLAEAELRSQFATVRWRNAIVVPKIKASLISKNKGLGAPQGDASSTGAFHLTPRPRP